MEGKPVSNLPKRRKGKKAKILICAIFLLVQAYFIFKALYELNAFALTSYIIVYFITIITALNLSLDNRKSSYKLAWITVLISIPIFGLVCYFMWGKPRQSKRLKRRIPLISEMTIPLYKWNPDYPEKLAATYPDGEKMMKHLNNNGFPVYGDTSTRYYRLGDDLFPELFEDIKHAKKFIFIEYFIVSEGQLLTELVNILEQKAREGVEIKILYDDFGCISTLPDNFVSDMKSKNIEAAPFNKVIPVLNNFYLNYRNHQKICVIDGNIAYTGGVNLADEYANLVEAFGHWKDTGIRLEGPGVWSMTIMFLQMWQYTKGSKIPGSLEEISATYAPDIFCENPAGGFVQPFCNGPCSQNINNTAEHVYLNVINSAKNYIYITTPYLVLDSEVQTSLIIAARSGVDVRIITPGIPDKKYVHLVTNSHYGKLLEAGVKIYEYTPGFIHSKSVVCDDYSCLVGTINMDFRSFFLHFENAVWMCGTSSVADVKSDFLETLDNCCEISLESWKKRPVFMKLKQRFLNFFSPLL